MRWLTYLKLASLGGEPELLGGPEKPSAIAVLESFLVKGVDHFRKGEGGVGPRESGPGRADRPGAEPIIGRPR